MIADFMGKVNIKAKNFWRRMEPLRGLSPPHQLCGFRQTHDVHPSAEKI